MLFRSVVGQATGAAYEVLLVARYGGTLGKLACGIEVVTPSGARISYLRSLGRHFAKFLSAITAYIGFLMAAFDSENRSLHDRICNTRVVFR